MALTLNNPIQLSGVTYDKYLLNLAISPNNQGDYIGIPLSMVLTPFTDAGGTIQVLNDPEYIKQLTLADAKQGDAAIQQAAGVIEYTIQQYINQKNW
jgi:hypothetical protein